MNIQDNGEARANRTLIRQQYDIASNVTVEAVMRYVEPVQTETTLETILGRFLEDKGLFAIPVLNGERPVGLIDRHAFENSLAQLCVPALPAEMPCADTMNAAPLLVDKSTPIHELSGFLSQCEIRHFAEGFIITEQGRYIGIGTGQGVLREITKTQIDAARYANPLTLLPGHVPINEHIEHLLQSGKSFAVCFVDIDNLRLFNDVYGYRKGDELIQITGELLGNVCDPTTDLIGHTHGDDFILVLQSPDWKQRCEAALSAFAHTSSALFDKSHRSIGGYLCTDRQGRIVHHPLPTLSIGAVWIIPKLFESQHAVTDAATDAKRLAKEKRGNSLFVERRHLFQHQVSEKQEGNSGVYYGN